jgi:spoIIIJ-associated protein
MANNIEELIHQFISDLSQHLEIPLHTRIKREAEEDIYKVELEIEDQDQAGLIIGKHGKTLSSIQRILGMYLYRKTGTWTRVLVDIGNYRESQEEKIKELAHNAADRARFFARPVEMAPMNPYKRRIVHTALGEDPDVETESTGEGKNRRVVVKPVVQEPEQENAQEDEPSNPQDS